MNLFIPQVTDPQKRDLYQDIRKFAVENDGLVHRRLSK
jgi:hypothetical protein